MDGAVMAVQVAQVAVSTTAAALSGTETDHSGGQALQFTTPASPVMYIGPAGVTSGTGYALAVSTEYFYDLQGDDALYVVVASGSATLPVMRKGV